MAKNKYKETNLQQPIEKQDTAAWANIEKTKDVSKVTIPSETQTNNNREWVNVNQK